MPKESCWCPVQPSQISVDHLTRQLDLLHVEKLGLPIRVIGAGAIGSFTVLMLVKMGFKNVAVWDFDTVSVENMSCQFYRFRDIGNAKALALQGLVKDFTNVDIAAYAEEFDEVQGQLLSGVVISAVDDMNVRRMIFETILRSGAPVSYLIDPRMSAEYMTMHTVRFAEDKSVEAYKNTLYSNDQAVQERCTAKATVYTANLASGLIARNIKNIAMGLAYDKNVTWDIAMGGLSQLQAYSTDGEKNLRQ